MSNNRSIGIIGGGMMGMTLALRLSEQGFKVTLLEAQERTGGLAVPVTIGDYTWDQFYHVILLSDRNLLDLLDRLDLKEKIRWTRTKTGFFADRRLHSMSNIVEFLSFPPLSLAQRIRLGLAIFFASRIKDGERLEKISVSDWLTHLSGKSTFNKVWLPLLKGKLGENYRVTSASFIWAIIARMYAARRSGLKQEMFGYVEGGYATILKHLRKRLDEGGVETLCRTPVERVLSRNGKVDVVSREGSLLQFDDVILTISANEIPNLCPDLSPSERQRLEKIKYQGVVCAAFLLKRSLSDYYITNITDGALPFTAVIEMTSVVDRNHFGGSALVYLPLYVTHHDRSWTRTDQEIQDEFLRGLEMMHPSFQREDILACTVVRAKDVLPVTTLNYSRELLPPAKTSLEHVFVVNSAQIANGTMNVNEIIGLANQKTKQIEQMIG